jgi:hypothetical protein
MSAACEHCPSCGLGREHREESRRDMRTEYCSRACLPAEKKKRPVAFANRLALVQAGKLGANFKRLRMEEPRQPMAVADVMPTAVATPATFTMPMAMALPSAALQAPSLMPMAVPQAPALMPMAVPEFLL